MKFLSAFLATLLLLLPTPARAAAIVEGSVADILGIGVPWARIQFTPLSNPQAESGVIITSQPKTISSTADGLFSVPLEQGDYVVVIAGRDTFQISVPNTTNTYILQDLITTSLAYSYSQTPASGPADWYGAAVVLNTSTSNALRSSITALSGSSGSGLTTTSNALRSSITANTASITLTSNVLRSDLTTASNYALTTINSSSNLLQIQIDGITTSTNTSYSLTSTSNALRADITTLQSDLTTTSNALRSGISANTSSITTTSNALRSDITANGSAITTSSNSLQLQIDGISGSTNYSSAITSTSNALRSDITTLQSGLTTTSNALRSDITANGSAITTTSNALRSDITANGSAITTLQGDLTTTSNVLRSDITSTGSLITTSSNALQLQIDAVSGGTNYAAAITTTSNVLSARISGAGAMVDNVAQLTALDTSLWTNATTRGYWSIGDGGAGVYHWASGSSATTNGGTILPATGGRWQLVHSGKVSLLQFGLKQNDLEADGPANAQQFQAALNTFFNGGHLYLPPSTMICYVGPSTVRPTAGVTNLVIEIDGHIKRPTATAFPAGHPYSFLHFASGYPIENLTLRGVGTISGNSMNQGSSVTNSYGKENGIRIESGKRFTLEGLTIRDFGGFAVFVGSSADVSCSRLTITQTNGNWDTYPTRWGANADGIHFYRSCEVRVNNCRISSTDDCIAVTGLDGYSSTNYVISHNILSPYVGGAGIVNSGIRIGMDGAATTGIVGDIKISDTIIDCHASCGMYIGCNTASDRLVTGIHVENVTINNAFVGNIQIGPNIGTAPTQTVSGGAFVLQVTDCEFRNVTINNAKGGGVNLANVGKFRWHGGSIYNVVDGGGSWPRGTGIALWQGLYGDVDFCEIKGVSIDKVDGGGILGGGGNTYKVGSLIVDDCRITRWNQGLLAGRTYSAVGAQNFLTNSIQRLVAHDGQAAIFAHAVNSGDCLIRVEGGDFGDLGTNATSRPYQYFEFYNGGSTILGSMDVRNNRFGSWVSGSQLLRGVNLKELRFGANRIIAPSFPSAVSSYAIQCYYSAASGSPIAYLNANEWSTADANGPTYLVRLENSGGSSVTPVVRIRGDDLANHGLFPLSSQFTTGIEIDWPRGAQRTVSGGSTTLTLADNSVYCQTTCTVTLPNATLCYGKEFVVKNAPTTATLTLTPYGAQTIDGLSSVSTTVVNAVYRVISDGANWLQK